MATLAPHPPPVVPQRRVFATVLRQAVGERLVLVSVVALVLLGMGALVGALWPPMQDTLAELQEALPPAIAVFLGEAGLGTPAGWAQAEMLSVVAPAAVITAAAASASRATAGEEEARTLGVLLAAPVGRLTFLWAKAAAMAVHTLIAAAAVSAGLVVADRIGGMDLGPSAIVAVGLHGYALGLLFGALALLVAVATGSRRRTTAVVSTLAGLAFAVHAFFPLSDALADGITASPWYYYIESEPIVHGADWGHLLVLLAATAAVLAAAAAAFPKRDLRG